MKILYHHRTKSKDGQAVHIEELVAALRSRGHEVIVVGPEGMDRAELGSESLRVVLLKRFMPQFLYELLELAYSIVAYRRLKRVYLEHRPDVLYERYNLFLLAGLWLARRYDLPFLLEVNAPLLDERREHDGLANRRLASWCERTTWRAASSVLAVTAVLKARIVEAGVPSERVVVIPNGVDLREFTQRLPEHEAKRRLGIEGGLTLGFTGFVKAWHGLEAVIDLLARFGAKRDLRLLVVGDGPARSALERKAAELGVADRVHFCGIVPRERIAEHIAAFDIALQPAVVSYASPLKLFEYMALGRAIIAPRQANIAEVLTDEETALLFDPSSPTAFESQLMRLVGDQELRIRLGAAAAKEISSRGFTWANNAARVELLMTTLTRARSSEEERARAMRRHPRGSAELPDQRSGT
jgi:glycosyltransferase involved in cell wall biosynthesis